MPPGEYHHGGTPPPPGSGFISGPFRYSIMLSGGSRLLACPLNAWLSFDHIAGAKCFAVVAASVGRAMDSVELAGVLPLKNIPPGTAPFRISSDILQPSSFLLEHIEKPSSRILTSLIFGLRLIILGEPDAPPDGAGGIKGFKPAGRAPGEV